MIKRWLIKPGGRWLSDNFSSVTPLDYPGKLPSSLPRVHCGTTNTAAILDCCQPVHHQWFVEKWQLEGLGSMFQIGLRLLQKFPTRQDRI